MLDFIEMCTFRGKFLRRAPAIHIPRADRLARGQFRRLPIDHEPLLALHAIVMRHAAHAHLLRRIRRHAVFDCHRESYGRHTTAAQQITSDGEIHELIPVGEFHATVEAAVIIQQEHRARVRCIERFRRVEQLLRQHGQAVHLLRLRFSDQKARGGRRRAVPAQSDRTSHRHAIHIVAVMQRAEVTQVVWRGPAHRDVQIALRRGVRHFIQSRRRWQNEHGGRIQRHTAQNAEICVRSAIIRTQLIRPRGACGHRISHCDAQGQRDGRMLPSEQNQTLRVLRIAMGRGDESAQFLRHRHRAGRSRITEHVGEQRFEIRHVLTELFRHRQHRFDQARVRGGLHNRNTRESGR